MQHFSRSICLVNLYFCFCLLSQCVLSKQRAKADVTKTQLVDLLQFSVIAYAESTKLYQEFERQSPRDM